jgi:lipid-A-disaccharide synthase
MKIMISAGEVSGDVHGSYLVKELKKLRPDILFFGMGSERLAAEGVDVKFDVSKRGTIGILEALPNVLPIYSTFLKMKKLLLKEKPDLVLLIDSQGFNMPFAKFCKKARFKTVYYIAPQEWLWGTPRGVKKVAETVDLIIAIFKMEYEAYKAAGANVVYFGHPLVDIVKVSGPVARDSQPTISICPGSRTQEIRGLLPILLKTGELIKKALPNAEFLVPVSSRKLFQEIFDLVGDFRPKAIFEQTYEVLAASDLAICASGTINLEASLLGTPNIMVYKLSPLTRFIGKYILGIERKIKYFSMPNILLDEKVVPELVMGEANPEKIAGEALSILKDGARQEKMKNSFAKLKSQLGSEGVIRKVAEAILTKS